MELSWQGADRPSESERAAVRELLEGACAGRGGALVVSGAPGTGGAALLDEAARAASDLGMRVLRSAGVAAESEIPYAALQLTLHQYLGSAAGLPPAQRGALETAFGLADGPAPEPLPTGLGVLGVLGALAADAPLALLVGDAHLLDRATAQALLIAVRRLDTQPVAVLAVQGPARGPLQGRGPVREPAGVPGPQPGLPAVREAEAALDAGDLAAARAAAAGAGTSDPRLARVQAAVHFARGSYPTAHQVLTDAAAAAEPGLAARLLLQDLHVAWYLGEAALGQVARSLAALRLPAGDPAAPLVGYAAAALPVALGEDAKPPHARDAVLEALRLGADLPRDLVQVCALTLAVGDDLLTHEFAAELDAAAEEQGLTGLRPTLLFLRAEAELFHGRPADARSRAETGLRLAERIGQRQWAGQLHGLLAYLDALAGDGAGCRAAAERSLRAAGDDTPVSAGGGWGQWALGLLDLGEGRAEDAAARLEALAAGQRRHSVAAVRALPDLVEALVRIGAPERAAAPLARFGRWAAAADQQWADSLVQRCRALLAPDEEAESCHRDALAAASEDRPFEQARTALVYGEWLRRARRRSDARQQLRHALEVFERLGAPHWAARARTELDAAGAAGAEPPAGAGGLTPQELRIVRLAARGLSNRDIAAQLFLSPRTVGYHLYKAYPKLGVASRAELRHVVGPAEPTARAD